jgi:hypothetical protein
MTWKVFVAAATGKSHLDGNTPCQDAVHYLQLDAGFVGVVCDGAGSASHGRQGADFIARALTERIGQQLRSGWLDPGMPPVGRECLLAVIETVRDALERTSLAQQCELRDFACTLVGCASTHSGGCFFHIGDGFAVHRSNGGQTLLSLPENGEFSDETYFVTQDNWRDHLRVTVLPAAPSGSLIGLMSDGTSPFAIDRGRTGFYGPFIDPVVRFLADATEQDGSRALLDVLASERTHAITGDDKSLLLALAV